MHCQREPAFGHHLDEVSKTQFVPQIPAHTENDNLPVEMMAFERFVHAYHADQIHRRGARPSNMPCFRSLRHSPGKKGWTLPYRRWLTTVRFDHPAQQVVLQDYIHSVHDAEERIARLMKQIQDLAPTWSMAPVVEAFQAMRGVAFVAAVTVVAEVRDFMRFDNPRQVMAYLGLTPPSIRAPAHRAENPFVVISERAAQRNVKRTTFDVPHIAFRTALHIVAS